MNTDNKVYLSLGSNEGDSYYYLLNAISNIDKLENTRVSKVSNFYKTKPWGNVEQNDFLNCAIEIYTRLLPYKLLDEINKIEKYLGRERKEKWGPRTIDIDIIFYDNLKIDDKRLCIPHKYYRQRAFVLLPLIDIYDKKEELLPFMDGLNKKEVFPYKYEKKILVSACLMGDKVRYDGSGVYNRLFGELIKNDYIKVCPEILGGLPIPRPCCEIKDGKIWNTKGEDLTKLFEAGAKLARVIALENSVEIAIMKEKSPSCGKEYIYNGNFEGKLIKGMGFASAELTKEKIKIINI